MNQGLVFNAKVIAGLVQQVNKLLRMDIDQIQTLLDGKPQRFSLACPGFSFLFGGVQRGYFSFQTKRNEDHESGRTADLSQRTSLAETDFPWRLRLNACIV